MQLAISNIAWEKIDDLLMYAYLQEQDYKGIEIAPTRLFPAQPYEHLDEAGIFADFLFRTYGLHVISLQSIWYGKSESIFGTLEERKELLAYTKKAIDFAAKMKCPNLVFGCPRNRNLLFPNQKEVAVEFFRELAEYANQHETTIAMEANPDIYGTNFLNTTIEALNFVKEVGCAGFALNYDIGTVIHNKEELLSLDDIKFVNHVHISEPYLNRVEIGDLQKELVNLLQNAKYQHFVSIEMKNMQDLMLVKNTVLNVKKIFG